MSISHIVLVALLLCFTLVQGSLVTKNSVGVVKNAKTLRCDINCLAYKNKATDKKICTGCKKNGKLTVAYSGPHCPTLDEVQHLFPEDQAETISQVVDFCRVALGCKCSPVTAHNSDLIVEYA
jgi:hypothetical protein